MVVILNNFIRQVSYSGLIYNWQLMLDPNFSILTSPNWIPKYDYVFTPLLKFKITIFKYGGPAD